jgi:hypothetical protein
MHMSEVTFAPHETLPRMTLRVTSIRTIGWAGDLLPARTMEDRWLTEIDAHQGAAPDPRLPPGVRAVRGKRHARICQCGRELPR